MQKNIFMAIFILASTMQYAYFNHSKIGTTHQLKQPKSLTKNQVFAKKNVQYQSNLHKQKNFHKIALNQVIAQAHGRELPKTKIYKHPTYFFKSVNNTITTYKTLLSLLPVQKQDKTIQKSYCQIS